MSDGIKSDEPARNLRELWLAFKAQAPKDPPFVDDAVWECFRAGASAVIETLVDEPFRALSAWGAYDFLEADMQRLDDAHSRGEI